MPLKAYDNKALKDEKMKGCLHYTVKYQSTQGDIYKTDKIRRKLLTSKSK